MRAVQVLICDRYIASSYVLHQMGGVPWPFIESLNSDTDLPDLAITLITEFAEATARIAARGARSVPSRDQH